MISRATIAFVVLFIGVACAAAQVGPDGNAHPQSHAISDSAGALSNPFGAPVAAPPVSPEEKHAFAERLDLEPLRGVAVWHNRVKIIDTLARESVRRLTGRYDYIDGIRDGEDVRKGRYDPLFTFLDTVIDPGYYSDKPLIHVDFLPLRQSLLEQAFPGDEKEQKRWTVLTRVSPQMLDRHATTVFDAHAGEQPYHEAIMRAENARELFRRGIENLRVIAPETKTDRWFHLAEAPDGSAVRVAATDLGRAWRARDVEGANDAIARLGRELPAINAELYPAGRRSLELAYNRSNAFEWGYWAYFVSLVTLVLAFGTGRRWLVIAGVGALVIALGFHSFGFAARCVIAERFAIQNQFESMTGLSLFAAVAGLVIMLVRRQWLFGAAAAGTGFLVLITATQTGIPGESIEREAAILNTSVLLKYHVTTVLTSYGLITLGFIVSLFYLGTHYGTKFFGRESDTPAVAVASGALGHDADPDHKVPVARTLKDLDAAQMTVLQLAFWTLGVGILLGAWWADHSWGRWWAFDPKETWALVTWIIYLIVIHVRFTTKNRALVTAWLSLVGFIVMLWTYFGVNLLLPGLHAYA